MANKPIKRLSTKCFKFLCNKKFIRIAIPLTVIIILLLILTFVLFPDTWFFTFQGFFTRLVSLSVYVPLVRSFTQNLQYERQKLFVKSYGLFFEEVDFQFPSEKAKAKEFDIKNFRPQKKKLLDYGSGFGGLANMFDLFFDITVSDIRNFNLFGNNFIPLNSIPQNEVYDICSIYHVLHHVSNEIQNEIFKTLERHCKVIIVSEECLADKDTMCTNDRWTNYNPYEVCNFKSHDEWVKFFKDRDLEIVKMINADNFIVHYKLKTKK